MATELQVAAECYLALGEGAAGKHYGDAAISAIRVMYEELLAENVASWDENRQMILDFARALGEAAAAQAKGMEIGADDVQQAVGYVALRCPLCIV